jgi:hypothetical protein
MDGLHTSTGSRTTEPHAASFLNETIGRGRPGNANSDGDWLIQTLAAVDSSQRKKGSNMSPRTYLNGNSFTTWHVPHEAVYGMGIARPGGTPWTPTFVFRGTSNTWDFNGLSQ